MTITTAQLARLEWINERSCAVWKELKAMEREAYSITQEDDINGYTSDLIWQSDASVEQILELVGVSVEEAKP